MLWLADLDGAISGKGPVRSIKKGLRSLKTLFIRRLQVLYLRGPPLLPPFVHIMSVDRGRFGLRILHPPGLCTHARHLTVAMETWDAPAAHVATGRELGGLNF